MWWCYVVCAPAHSQQGVPMRTLLLAPVLQQLFAHYPSWLACFQPARLFAAIVVMFCSCVVVIVLSLWLRQQQMPRRVLLNARSRTDSQLLSMMPCWSDNYRNVRTPSGLLLSEVSNGQRIRKIKVWNWRQASEQWNVCCCYCCCLLLVETDSSASVVDSCKELRATMWRVFLCFVYRACCVPNVIRDKFIFISVRVLQLHLCIAINDGD